MTEHIADAKETQLELFKADIDIYKFHMGLIIKLATFIFAITGAVVSYSTAHYNTAQAYVLILPLVVNVATAILFLPL